MTPKELVDAIFQKGRKIECPFCDGRHMSQNHISLIGSGIGQHIMARHPEHAAAMKTANKLGQRRDRDRYAAEMKAIEDAEKEADRRSKREFTVTGEFLDEVIGELRGLIRMMEPYYSQGNCDADAERLIEQIEKMHREAREAEQCRPPS